MSTTDNAQLPTTGREREDFMYSEKSCRMCMSCLAILIFSVFFHFLLCLLGLGKSHYCLSCCFR